MYLAFLAQTTDYSTAFKDLAYFASTLFSLSGTICLAAPYWYNTLVFADEPHRKTDFLAALISQHCPANSPKHATRQCSWVCPCCVQIFAMMIFLSALLIGLAGLLCTVEQTQAAWKSFVAYASIFVVATVVIAFLTPDASL